MDSDEANINLVRLSADDNFSEVVRCWLTLSFRS